MFGELFRRAGSGLRSLKREAERAAAAGRHLHLPESAWRVEQPNGHSAHFAAFSRIRGANASENLGRTLPPTVQTSDSSQFAILHTGLLWSMTQP